MFQQTSKQFYTGSIAVSRLSISGVEKGAHAHTHAKGACKIWFNSHLSNGIRTYVSYHVVFATHTDTHNGNGTKFSFWCFFIFSAIFFRARDNEIIKIERDCSIFSKMQVSHRWKQIIDTCDTYYSPSHFSVKLMRTVLMCTHMLIYAEYERMGAQIQNINVFFFTFHWITLIGNAESNMIFCRFTFAHSNCS